MFIIFSTLASCAFYLQHEEKSFLSWMRLTNQFFTGDDYHLRFGIYLSNLRRVKEHNAAHKSFRVGMNKFAALTPSEYRSLLGVRITLSNFQSQKNSKSMNLESIDWRDKGVVSPISDQGSCGSCWAFSAIQSIESVNAISSGQLRKFSEQNIVDCVNTCSGCNGGLMTDAYQYVIDHQGGQFVLEDDYKYTARDGNCRFDECPHIGTISKYVNIIEGDEDDLYEKVQLGPVAVAIDASTWSFTLYKEGIYDEPLCSPTNLDHGVGCVGFGTENGVSYWIVRNSWGTSWGEQGYMKLIRKNNQCGIASMATFPYA
ncbi:hypothetical protein M9Y10_027631 [Tritrichomonas musculus]|uniref:Uncharacterized protein n=1 Tax=Tritrichomonas musculus TaxID=1915356 RepID=A0ABR2H3K2_9EUKA